MRMLNQPQRMRRETRRYLFSVLSVTSVAEVCYS